MIEHLKRKILVRDIAADLKSEILASKSQPGTPLMSAKDLAKKFNVSVLTAHRAMRLLTVEGLLYRTRGSGTYISDSTNGKRFNFGVSSFSQSYDNESHKAAFGIYLDIIAQNLKAQHHSVTYIAYEDFQDQNSFCEKISKMDGIILSSSHLDGRTYAMLKDTGKKIVLFQHEKIWDYQFDQVIPDLFTGYADAFSHLKSKGHETIALLWLNNNTHEYRKDVAVKAAMQSGFSSDKIIQLSIEKCPADTGRLSGQYLASKFLDECKNVSAIFSVSDFISFGLLDIFRNKGIVPGKDIDIISYDDLEGEGLLPFGEPELTAITNPKRKCAEESVAMLLESIKRNTDINRISRVPTTLIFRKTCH